MLDKLMERLKEAVLSVVPVMIVMIIIGLFLNFNMVTMSSILFSTILLIFGMALFTFGADLFMIEIGKSISTGLLKTKRVSIIAIVSFIVGVVITIAEPDLKVLANQMTAINDMVLILCVGIGVGLFLCIAALRIIFQINLKYLLTYFYIFLSLMMLMSNKEMIPLAFDSGGVTTGPMSVPFILAMGIGFSACRASDKTENDSFGLVALCSVGPILTVMLLGMFMGGNANYTYNIGSELASFSKLIINYVSEIGPVFKDVLISLIPILGVYAIFVLFTKSFNKRKFIKILVGLPVTLVGLILFFVGVNVGYMPIAYLIGIGLYNKSKILLILLGLIIGFVIVKAEPAIAVLTEQIEKITHGSIKKSTMVNTIALGVALAVCISIIRVLTGISLIGFLIVGYLLALILMIFSPNMFTMVSFDSGGAVSGPMTTTFLLPLIIGVCYATGGNVLTDAFGLVALVALSPLITIQILGIIYKVKSNKAKRIVDSIDESIIEFDWRDKVE